MEMRFFHILMLLLPLPGHPYKFEYKVNRPRDNLSFGHREAREGDLTSGDYRVLLPDGRTQVVEYRVEGENTGYIVSVKYQGDPKGKAPDDPSSVRKREIVRQRKPWKPYAREKTALKSSETSKSAIRIISGSKIEVLPKNTATTSVPEIMASASSQLSEVESIDSMPHLLLTTGIPQTVQDSISEPEVNPQIDNLDPTILTTEKLFEAYTEEEEWPPKPSEGLAHLDNHIIAPSKSVLPDEPTTILVGTSTPSTTVTLLKNDHPEEKEETNVEEKPRFWTPLASSRTSGSDLTKNHRIGSDFLPALSPKIKAEQLHATILKNVPIPVRSSFVLEPSLSFQQRTPRLTSSFHGNARNSWGSPVVFSQQGNPRSAGSIRLKTQNSLANPGMALHIPLPQTFPLESPSHIKQNTLPTSNYIHLSHYHAPVVNSGRRIDGRTRLGPFPQFPTSYSNIRPGVKRPCRRNLRTKKKASKTFSGPWFNLF